MRTTLIILVIAGFFITGWVLSYYQRQREVDDLKADIDILAATEVKIEMDLYYHRLAVRSLVAAHSVLTSAQLDTDPPLIDSYMLDDDESREVARIIKDVKLS